MDRWMVSRSRAISPPSGDAFDAAYVVTLSRREAVRELVVEFAAPSSVASGGYAEEISRRFQDDQEPPQHVALELDGSVRVLIGAREPRPEDVDGSPVGRVAQGRSPQRARTRRRG